MGVKGLMAIGALSLEALGAGLAITVILVLAGIAMTVGAKAQHIDANPRRER